MMILAVKEPKTLETYPNAARSQVMRVNVPSPKGEGFRETAQAGYESARGRPQSHTILKLSSGSSGT